MNHVFSLQEIMKNIDDEIGEIENAITCVVESVPSRMDEAVKVESKMRELRDLHQKHEKDLLKMNQTYHKIESRIVNLRSRNTQLHDVLQKKIAESSSLSVLLAEKEKYLSSFREIQRERTKSMRQEEFEHRKRLNEQMNEAKRWLAIVSSQISEGENRAAELREVTEKGIQSMRDEHCIFKAKCSEQRMALQGEILQMKTSFSDMRMNMIQQKKTKEKEIQHLKEKLSRSEKQRIRSVQEALKQKNNEIGIIRGKKSAKENERDQLYFLREQTMNELSGLNRAISDCDEEFQTLTKEADRKENSLFEVKKNLKVRLQTALNNQASIEKELKGKMKAFSETSQKVKERKELYISVMKKLEDHLVQSRKKTEEMQNSLDESKKALSKSSLNLVQYQNKVKDAVKVFSIAQSQMKQVTKEKQSLTEDVDDARKKVVHQRTEKILHPIFDEFSEISDVYVENPHDSESFSLSDLQKMRETYNQFQVLLEAQRNTNKTLEKELKDEESKNAELKERTADLTKMKDEIIRWRKKLR